MTPIETVSGYVCLEDGGVVSYIDGTGQLHLIYSDPYQEQHIVINISIKKDSHIYCIAPNGIERFSGGKCYVQGEPWGLYPWTSEVTPIPYGDGENSVGCAALFYDLQDGFNIEFID